MLKEFVVKRYSAYKKPGAWPGSGFRVRFALLVHYGKSTLKTPPCQHITLHFLLFPRKSPAI